MLAPEGDGILDVDGIDDYGDVVGTCLSAAKSLPCVWLPTSSTPTNLAATDYWNGTGEDINLSSSNCIDYNGRIYGYGQVDALFDIDGNEYPSYDGVTWANFSASPTELGAVYTGNTGTMDDPVYESLGVQKVVGPAKNNHTIMRSQTLAGSSELPTPDSYFVDGVEVPDWPLAINTAGDTILINFPPTIRYSSGSTESITGCYNAYDINLSLLAKHNSDGSVTMMDCPQIIGTNPLQQPTVFQKNPDTNTYQAQKLSDLVSQGSGWSSLTGNLINDSGAVVGTATYTPTGTNDPTAAGSHGVMLITCALTNIADPYQGSSLIGTSSHNDQDTQIDLSSTTNSTDINGVAWIAAGDSTTGNAPRMPHLQAKIGAPSGCQVLWRLQVIYHDRFGNPHRNFDTGAAQDTDVPDDTVTIPATATDDDSTWKKITDGTPWSIYQETDWTTAISSKGFFGGDADLSVEIKSSDGSTTILPRMDWYFRVAGENPDATKCRTYINSVSGAPWYAYAIAKHETKDEGKTGYYNHFLDQGGKSSKVPGKEGVPDWNNDTTFKKDSSGNYILDGSGNRVVKHDANGSGGYGLFQLTYGADDPNFIEPRKWLWNYQDNTVQAIVEIQGKVSPSTSLYNGLLSTYSGCGAIPSHLHFTGLESIIITNYNGMYGGSVRRIKVNGYKNNPRTCWAPNSSGTGWVFLPNVNNYVDEVDALIDP